VEASVACLPVFFEAADEEIAIIRIDLDQARTAPGLLCGKQRRLSRYPSRAVGRRLLRGRPHDHSAGACGGHSRCRSSAQSVRVAVILRIGTRGLIPQASYHPTIFASYSKLASGAASSTGWHNHSPSGKTTSMTDRIFVSNLFVQGYHGVLAEETRLGQKFFIDIDCAGNLKECVRDDDYSKAVCYAPCLTWLSRYRRVDCSSYRDSWRPHCRTNTRSVLIRVRSVRPDCKPSYPVACIVDHVGIEVNRVRGTQVAFPWKQH
jgi:dihydroneopterin aldolase